MALNLSKYKTQSSRLATIDCVKGFAIIGVVLVHTIWINHLLGSNLGAVSIEPDFSPMSVLPELLYSSLFMFFVISGYFYKPNRGFVKNVKKRLLQLVPALVICTVVLVLVVYALMLAAGYTNPSDKVFNYIVRVLIGENFADTLGIWAEGYMPFYALAGPYYFIEILMVGFVVFYAVADFALKDWKRFLVVMAVLTAATFVLVEYRIVLPWHIQVGPVAAAFMLAGAFMGKHKVVEYIESEWKTAKYWAIFLGVAVLAVVLMACFPSCMNFNSQVMGRFGGWSAFTLVPGMLASGYVLMVLMFIFSKIPGLSHMLKFVGKRTLGIFLFHMFYLKLMALLFLDPAARPGIELPFTSIGQALLFSALSIIFSIITEYAIRYAMKKIGIGKKNGPSPGKPAPEPAEN